MSKSHKFIVAVFGIIIAAGLAENVAKPLILAWALKPSANTTPDTFGPAVDTNHWFKVDDKGYYVLVRTNVWPLEDLHGVPGNTKPRSIAPEVSPLITWPRVIRFGGWKISALDHSTNSASLILQSLNREGVSFIVNDFNFDGGRK